MGRWWELGYLTKCKLRILFLSSWYPNRRRSLEGNFVARHAACAARYHDVWVLSVHEDAHCGPFELQLEKNPEHLSGHVAVYYGKPRFFSSFFGLLNRFRAYHRGFRALDQPAFELVHANVTLYSGLFALFLFWRHGWPYLISEHSTVYLPEGGLSRLQAILARLAWRQATAVLPVSENLEKNMRRCGYRGQAIVVPNAVDTQIFRPGLPPKGVFRFLHISSLHPWQKNIDGLLEAIRQLADTRQDFHLTVAGTGSFASLEQKVRNARIEAFTTFIGPLTEQEVVARMQQSHAFVLSSRIENLPCVLLEAQACGLPVIATDTGGVSEIVDKPELGYLAPVNDTKQLTTLLDLMMNNRKNLNRAVIRNIAVNRYGYRQVAGQLHEIYLSIADQHNA